VWDNEEELGHIAGAAEADASAGAHCGPCRQDPDIEIPTTGPPPVLPSGSIPADTGSDTVAGTPLLTETVAAAAGAVVTEEGELDAAAEWEWCGVMVGSTCGRFA